MTVCNYGYCEDEAVWKVNHEGVHHFCEYHYQEVNP